MGGFRSNRQPLFNGIFYSFYNAVPTFFAFGTSYRQRLMSVGRGDEQFERFSDEMCAQCGFT